MAYIIVVMYLLLVIWHNDLLLELILIRASGSPFFLFKAVCFHAEAESGFMIIVST